MTRMSPKGVTGNKKQKRKEHIPNKEDIKRAVGEEKQIENKDEEIEITLLFNQDTAIY